MPPTNRSNIKNNQSRETNIRQMIIQWSSKPKPNLVRMAYNCELSRLPSVCECSMKFDLTQGRKKRNRFAKTLKWSRFCSSYRGKASSNIQLEGTRFDLIYALDGFGKCFWSEGFNPNAVRSAKLELSKSKEINEKKRRSITMNA